METYISDEDYALAYGFAYKYQQLKRMYRKLSFITPKSIAYYSNTGGTRGNGISQPTEISALKLAEIAEQIDLIEKTAYEIAGDDRIAEALIECVGKHIPYDYLYPMPPISKSGFYRLRRRYYQTLSIKIKEGDEENE